MPIANRVFVVFTGLDHLLDHRSGFFGLEVQQMGDERCVQLDGIPRVSLEGGSEDGDALVAIVGVLLSDLDKCPCGGIANLIGFGLIL